MKFLVVVTPPSIYQSLPTSSKLMVSNAIIYKSTFSLLSGRQGVWEILALFAVSSLLPASSDYLVVFQVFRSTFQSDTELPINATMASRGG